MVRGSLFLRIRSQPDYSKRLTGVFASGGDHSVYSWDEAAGGRYACSRRAKLVARGYNYKPQMYSPAAAATACSQIPGIPATAHTGFYLPPGKWSVAYAWWRQACRDEYSTGRDDAGMAFPTYLLPGIDVSNTAAALSTRPARLVTGRTVTAL